MTSFNHLLIDRLETSDPNSVLDWLDTFKSSMSVKGVLWFLSNTNWTVEDLTRFFEGEFHPSCIVRPDGSFGQGKCVEQQTCSEVSSDKISELAYLLAESEGFPEGQNERFWNEAVLRLTPRNWQIKSGELLVEGYGDLDSVLSLAYTKANNDCLSLGEITYANSFEDSDGTNYEFDYCYFEELTQKQLERLGLWS